MGLESRHHFQLSRVATMNKIKRILVKAPPEGLGNDKFRSLCQRQLGMTKRTLEDYLLVLQATDEIHYDKKRFVWRLGPELLKETSRLSEVDTNSETEDRESANTEKTV